MYSAKARVGDEKLIKRKLSILEPERKKKKRDVIFSEIAFLFKDCTGSSVMLVPRFLHFISKKEKGVMGLTLTGSEVC